MLLDDAAGHPPAARIDPRISLNRSSGPPRLVGFTRSSCKRDAKPESASTVRKLPRRSGTVLLHGAKWSISGKSGCRARPRGTSSGPKRGTKIARCIIQSHGHDALRRRRGDMSISRREFGVLGAAALAFRARHANAGERDVFVFGQDLPANLDPHQILDLGMTGYALNTYDNLYRYEDNPPKMQPWLAISHTSSPDGLVWDFKLRQGVRFHDGSELVADDVVYSVQRLLGIGRAPAAPFLPTLKPESVNAPDRYTVRFTLDRPYGPFFGMIPMVFIVNPRAVKPHEEAGDWGARWLASNEAGSGTYRLIPSSYLPLEHADVEKYDDHFYSWRENSQAIKKVEWRPTKVTSTRVLALLNGTIDMTDSFLPVDQVERIDKAPNAHVAKNVTMRLLVIRMNNTKPPFDNINARKCFAHAFNYTGFIEEIVKGNALRNPAPLPNNIWG